MDSILSFVLAMFIAAATTFLVLVLGLFPNIRYRNHLPLVCGIFFVAVVLVVNPQQGTGAFHDLYNLKLLSPMLLLPFFILAPVPYIEKWTGLPFNKISVFFGSLLAALFYCVILAYGNYYFDQTWLEGLQWTISSIIPAFFIFCGVYFCQKFLEESPSEKLHVSPSEKDLTASIPMEKRKKIVLIVALLAFLLPFFLFGILGNTEGCGRFEVYSMNQSQTLNGTIIHLTEEDFREFPKMSSIIKDASHTCETSGNCTNETGKVVGGSWFACRDERQLYKYNGVFLEYNGNFYSMKQTMVY
jgi:hypothetical protein